MTEVVSERIWKCDYDGCDKKEPVLPNIDRAPGWVLLQNDISSIYHFCSFHHAHWWLTERMEGIS